MEKPKLIRFANRASQIVSWPSIVRDGNRILATLNRDEYDALIRKYSGILHEVKLRQHFDLRKNVHDQVKICYSLGLQKAGKLRILDIGTGKGFFPYVCKAYGHQAMGLDWGQTAYFMDQVAYLKIHQPVWRIKAFNLLPDLGGRFDLITAFQICFNNHRENPWDVPEWDFFLRDLKNHHLTKMGRVFLNLNPEENKKYYTPSLLAYFKSMGAITRSDKVYFPTMAAFPAERISAVRNEQAEYKLF